MKNYNIKKLSDLDLSKIFNEYKDLVVQVFQVGYICELVKDYRYKRAEKFKSYNIFNTTIHVALENFYLLLLSKFFDKRSKMNVYEICDVMKDSKFKNFFNTEIKKIEQEINILEKWRSRIIVHCDITVRFNSKPFESKYQLNDKGIKKLKDFLFEFLCQLDYLLCPRYIKPAKNIYQEVLDDLKKFVLEGTQQILKDFPVKYDSNQNPAT